MFDVKEYFKERNEKVKESYGKTLSKIKGVIKKTGDLKKAGGKAEYYKFFNKVGSRILDFAELEKQLDEDYFAKRNPEQLAEQNAGYFSELLPENYDKCYANPAYAVKIFGDKTGQLFAYWYQRLRQYITYAFTHKIFEMEKWNRLYLEVFEYIEANDPLYGELSRMITSILRERKVEDMALEMAAQLDPGYGFYLDIVENSDLSDLRYLYSYGTYVSDNERKIAKFLASYPEEKIRKLSAEITRAYVDGFKRDGKDLSSKSTVRIMYSIGQERIVRQLISDLGEKGLKSIVIPPSSTRPNRQYDYDHRFDQALWIDEEWVRQDLAKTEKAFEQNKDLLKAMSGIAAITKFGEKPFKPETKTENLTMDPEQQKLRMTYQGGVAQIMNNFAPQSETSFTVISFPSPEIGDHFEDVFEDILEVNMLDSARYDKLQKKIIDVLDKAAYVHIKGKDQNKTDIKVNLHTITDPAKQTNFLNCLADINIPVGEVFTTPVLSKTSGTLHVSETFLNGLEFKDLTLDFEDGYIKNYSCTNFDSADENKKYIHENLLQPHETLPIGEFAIGTNTLAYVIARKHNILDVLPVLIIEKMGPHFAIGDTCFTRAEDLPVHNSDGKEVIARENERSALRKEDPRKAYTQKHTDITLPYDELEAITAITADGERIDIIRDGRFVVPGTQELNVPLDANQD